MRVLLAASDKAELKGFSDDYIKVVTGVGPILSASITMREAILNKADIIVSIGSAGAISDKLIIGEAYSFSSVITPDLDLTKFHLALGSTLDKNRATISEMRCSDRESGLVLLTSGTFASKANDALKADAADMEAYGAAISAYNLSIPFYAVKLITDRVGDSSDIGKVAFNLREGRAKLIALVDSLVRQ